MSGDALVGEPQKQAIAICSWAARTDVPEGALMCWGRKRSKDPCHRVQHAPPHRPSRRHEEISPLPREDTDDGGRGSGPTRPGDSLRGVLVEAGTLERTAERLGVS
jgi:hypothetical protein